MKKIAIGCLAVVLALAASAFTRPHAPKGKNFVYYFGLTGEDPLITPLPTSWPPPTTNTYHCYGYLDPCSAGYPAYINNNGIYTASGTMVGGTETYQHTDD